MDGRIDRTDGRLGDGQWGEELDIGLGESKKAIGIGPSRHCPEPSR